MAKKSIDTEALKKNKFWIGLGAFGLLWLVGVIVVLLSSDAKARTEWESTEKAIKQASSTPPKTAAYQAPWHDYGKRFSDHKDTIWSLAWKEQAGMYTWPEGMAVVPQYPDDPWGGDTNSELDNRGRFREQYKTQFIGLASLVAPAELEGGLEAIVPHRDWNKSRAPSREEIWLAQEDYWVRRELLSVVRDAMNAVAYFKDLTDEPVPLDQVPKEVLEAAGKKSPKGQVVRASRETVEGTVTYEVTVKDGNKDLKVVLTPEGKDGAKAKLPEGIVGRRVFRNANWELDLQFETAKDSKRWVISEKSTIKNITNTGSTLALANPRTRQGLGFRVWQNEGRSRYDMLIAGEPVAPEKTVAIKLSKPDMAPINPQQPFAVEQLLEWEISPVRKIEALELAYHSHRTIPAGYKIREDLKKLDPEPEEPKEGQAGDKQGGSSSGPPPGMSMGPKPGGVGGGPGGDTAAAQDATRINKIDRARYMHVKEQARHLPVAMKLVVEQSHIHDVLTAVANSRLRIQVTQASMHHVRNVSRVKGKDKDKDDKGGTPGMPAMPGMPGGYSPKGPPGFGSGGSLGPPPSFPGMPGMPGVPGGSRDDGPGPGRTPPSQTADSAVMVQDTARLVEVTIYGLATLYERFPARKKPETTPGTTSGTTPGTTK